MILGNAYSNQLYISSQHSDTQSILYRSSTALLLNSPLMPSMLYAVLHDNYRPGSLAAIGLLSHAGNDSFRDPVVVRNGL